MTFEEMSAELQQMAEKALPKSPHATNVEKVTQFMEWGSPMNQIVVMLAVEEYVTKILDNKERVRKEMKDSFIHPEAIIAACEEWRKQNPTK